MKTLLASGPASRLLPAASWPRLRRPAWLRLLHEGYPALAWAGWLHVALLLLALALWPLDPRTVTGLNVWVKPIKFGASGVVYLWTLGWLLADLPAVAQRAARRVGRLVAGSMAGEILLIFLQAARGTTSHFNVGSAFDGLVFSLMGGLIMVNTVAVVWALGLTLRYRPFGSGAWVGGVRLGLGLFLMGSAVGGSMAGRLAHTVGAPDGGAGLPFLGWSTRAGDLRAAHFLGLHALQVLPLVGWLVPYLTSSRQKQVVAVGLFALAYAGGVGWLYWHALHGLPLLAR